MKEIALYMRHSINSLLSVTLAGLTVLLVACGDGGSSGSGSSQSPDPLIEDDLCDSCMACVDACPVNALSRDDAVTFDLAGQTVRMSTIDRARCVPSHAGEEGWLKRHLPPHVTFAKGGHCGLCLLRCPKRGRQTAPSQD